MNTKKTIIAFVVLVILLAVVVIVEKPFDSSSEKIPEEELILFSDLNIDEITRININSRGSEVELKKINNQWKVQDEEKYFPVDEKAIDNLMNHLESMKVDEVVSENPENHVLFEVDSQGAEVKVFTDGEMPVAHFFVGKNGPDFFSTYVRLADEDRVLQVAEYLKSHFDKTLKMWKDRALIRAEKENIRAFSIDKKDSEEIIRIARVADDEEKWEITSPIEYPADEKPVNRIVNSFRNFMATDFVDPDQEEGDEEEGAETAEESGEGMEAEEERDAGEEKVEEGKLEPDYGFEEPTMRVAVELDDNTTKVILFGNKLDERNYYAKREGEEWVYKLPEYRYEMFDKPLEEFKAEPTPIPEPTEKPAVEDEMKSTEEDAGE